MFFLKFKTSVLLSNRFGKQAVKAFPNTSFSKATVVMQFPAKKTPVAQEHCTISRQEKMALFFPRRVVLGLTSPSPRVCMDGRTGVR